MKFVLLTLETKKEIWSQEAIETYSEKIQKFIDFEIRKIKSPGLDRSNQDEKLQRESKALLDFIKPDDYVILLDVVGEALDSKATSKALVKIMESAKKRAIFIIGGAFGVSDAVKNRSNQRWSLSKMTMNHLVAQVVLLEQIYRGLTIWKGIPYHNE